MVLICDGIEFDYLLIIITILIMIMILVFIIINIGCITAFSWYNLLPSA